MGSRSQPEAFQSLTKVSLNVDRKVDGRAEFGIINREILSLRPSCCLREPAFYEAANPTFLGSSFGGVSIGGCIIRGRRSLSRVDTPMRALGHISASARLTLSNSRKQTL